MLTIFLHAPRNRYPRPTTAHHLARGQAAYGITGVSAQKKWGVGAHRQGVEVNYFVEHAFWFA